jgi:predicted HTH domain antitoxin
MNLNLPDDIVARGELSEYDVRLALAIQLYADNRLDHSDACRLADISPATLNAALLTAGLSLQQYPARRLIDRRTAG